MSDAELKDKPEEVALNSSSTVAGFGTQASPFGKAVCATARGTLTG
jgi:hypothetical protein